MFSLPRRHGQYLRPLPHLLILLQCTTSQAFGVPPSLVQTSSINGREEARASLPTGFFEDAEDAVPQLSGAELLQRPKAPHDVGANAIKLPDDFEDARPELHHQKLSVLQQSPPQRSGGEASHAEKAPQGGRGFFSDQEDGVQQVFGRSPVHAVEAASLLAKDAVDVPAPEQVTDLEAVPIDEDSLPAAAARPIVVMGSKAIDLHQEEERESSAAAQEDSTGDSSAYDDSRAFVEELADQGAEHSSPSEASDVPARAEASLLEVPAPADEIPADVPAVAEVPRQKAHKKGVSLLSSKAKTSSSGKAHSSVEKGHSMLGTPVTPDGQLAEEGEEIIASEDATSLQFGSLPEAELREDARINAKKREVEMNRTVSRIALRKLRDNIYHSADMSRQRLEEAGKLETSLRRAELLSDANLYKAQLTQGDRVQEQAVADYERDLQLATAALQRERDLRNGALSAAAEAREEQLREAEESAEEASNLMQRALAVHQLQAADAEQQQGQAIQQQAMDRIPVSRSGYPALPEVGPALVTAGQHVQNETMLLESRGAKSHARSGHDICGPECASAAPNHQACTPQCSWQCDDPHCDEVCQPVCQAPQCETRCASADLSQCFMECDQPHCAVTCPQSQCPSGGCDTCQTTCSEPMCKLRCNNAQPCRNVCEQPVCDWKCHAPSQCPKPTCRLMCEAPGQCVGSTFASVPPLSPGEASVRSFSAAGMHMLQMNPGTPQQQQQPGVSLRGPAGAHRQEHGPATAAAASLSVPMTYRPAEAPGGASASLSSPSSLMGLEQRTVQIPVKTMQHQQLQHEDGARNAYEQNQRGGSAVTWRSHAQAPVQRY
mmetsp:Transcript_2501/g.5488  ORF Transcript_2501/g.5488 Transcript_2501/m.5488 type:complete len:835 (+) Transcript_2501:98-2602(+)